MVNCRRMWNFVISRKRKQIKLERNLLCGLLTRPKVQRNDLCNRTWLMLLPGKLLPWWIEICPLAGTYTGRGFSGIVWLVHSFRQRYYEDDKVLCQEPSSEAWYLCQNDSNTHVRIFMQLQHNTINTINWLYSETLYLNEGNVLACTLQTAVYFQRF